VQVLPLPRGQVWDIDRPEDLPLTRRRLISSASCSYFSRNISKEERNRTIADHLRDGGFLKVCQSASHAETERAALLWLRERRSPCPVPAVRNLRGGQLCLEDVDGIRLYDLLRLLRTIADQGGAEAAAAGIAGRTLLGRALQQLMQLQRDLFAWPGGADAPPYPLHTHLVQLLAALADVLGLVPLDGDERVELKSLQRIWEEADVRLPFRDATAKNIIMAVPALSPRRESDPQRRLEAVRAWLGQDQADRARLVEVDFASVVHRTAPEDDLYSLLAHAGTLPWGRELLADLDPNEAFWPRAVARLVPGIDPSFSPDPERAARALLVRYLRFGGRKLLYRALNPTAYGIRFRYDDPRPYFASLRPALLGLDPGFADRFPRLFDRLGLLERAVTLLPAWQPEREVHDFSSDTSTRAVVYWQESPLESAAATAGAGLGAP